jgi:predicted glycoside hydrolase/deacetylase ChbG (UPF0249 family)
MPGLTREGRLGKWIWQMAEEDSLPLDEIAHGWSASTGALSSCLAMSRRISTAITMCI